MMSIRPRGARSLAENGRTEDLRPLAESEHRGTGIQRPRGLAKLFFLPKYSPDLNPIEQVFAKLKHLLRKAAARSAETICVIIGEILRAFTPTECANYFRNSGYAQS
jgi:transposase